VVRRTTERSDHDIPEPERKSRTPGGNTAGVMDRIAASRKSALRGVADSP
jgi:hypothetical protein